VNLTPFLLFDGNCAEAMGFYQSCFGGDLTITRLADTPMKDEAPTEQHNLVAYARLESGAISISATDWRHPTRTRDPGNTVALYLEGGVYDELRLAFDNLAVGADKELLDDVREMPFGIYGHLADRYGVHWFFRGEQSRAGTSG
jgi:PhnB protein